MPGPSQQASTGQAGAHPPGRGRRGQEGARRVGRRTLLPNEQTKSSTDPSMGHGRRSFYGAARSFTRRTHRPRGGPIGGFVGPGGQEVDAHKRVGGDDLRGEVLGEKHVTEAVSVEECRGYRHFYAWPPALLGSWDDAGDEGDLVPARRGGRGVGARAGGPGSPLITFPKDAPGFRATRTEPPEPLPPRRIGAPAAVQVLLRLWLAACGRDRAQARSPRALERPRTGRARRPRLLMEEMSGSGRGALVADDKRPTAGPGLHFRASTRVEEPLVSASLALDRAEARQRRRRTRVVGRDQPGLRFSGNLARFERQCLGSAPT